MLNVLEHVNTMQELAVDVYSFSQISSSAQDKGMVGQLHTSCWVNIKSPKVKLLQQSSQVICNNFTCKSGD